MPLDFNSRLAKLNANALDENQRANEQQQATHMEMPRFGGPIGFPDSPPTPSSTNISLNQASGDAHTSPLVPSLDVYLEEDPYNTAYATTHDPEPQPEVLENDGPSREEFRRRVGLDRGNQNGPAGASKTTRQVHSCSLVIITLQHHHEPFPTSVLPLPNHP